MNKKILVFFMLFIVGQSTYTVNAAEDLKVGLGLGALYSGVGTNVALTSDNDMKYASLGCLAYSSNYGASCGVGLGWVKTGLINNDNKQGLGLYLGIVGMEKEFDDLLNKKRNNVYGGGISYNYYLNGINNNGTVVGVGYLYGSGKEEKINSVLLQVGYQF